MLQVSSELLQLGLSTAVVVAQGVDNSRSSPELLAYRRALGRRIGAFWKNRSLSTQPVFQEYERLHRLYGVTDEPAAPEKILRYVRRHQDFPDAGGVVDVYNMVSAKTFLSIGAHDRSKLKLPVTLRKVEAEDHFVALDTSSPHSCSGEYGYVDSDHQVVCRLEILQGNATKVDADSTEMVFFLQGNSRISSQELLAGCWLLVESIEKFCGGKAELTDFLEAPIEIPK